MDLRDSHYSSKTNSDHTCVIDCTHNALEGPHAQGEHEECPVMQVREGSSDTEIDCKTLVSHQKEPRDRFEHEEESDLQVFEKRILMEDASQ